MLRVYLKQFFILLMTLVFVAACASPQKATVSNKSIPVAISAVRVLSALPISPGLLDAISARLSNLAKPHKRGTYKRTLQIQILERKKYNGFSGIFNAKQEVVKAEVRLLEGAGFIVTAFKVSATSVEKSSERFNRDIARKMSNQIRSILSSRSGIINKRKAPPRIEKLPVVATINSDPLLKLKEDKVLETTIIDSTQPEAKKEIEKKPEIVIPSSIGTVDLPPKKEAKVEEVAPLPQERPTTDAQEGTPLCIVTLDNACEDDES